MTLSIGLKSGDPIRRRTQFPSLSENIEKYRVVDPVVRSSQRWPDDQDDRYLLSISFFFFHFFYPKNRLPPPPPRFSALFVALVLSWLQASFMLEEFLLFLEDREASLAANRLVVRLSVA